MKIEHVARAPLPVGGKVFPPGAVIPADLLRGRNIAPWVRAGSIELRGPGAEQALLQYKKAPVVGRVPSEAILRAAHLMGDDADRALERPLLEVDDDYGEALERAGHTVEDAVEAAAEGVELENEAEVQAELAQPRRRRR